MSTIRMIFISAFLIALMMPIASLAETLPEQVSQAGGGSTFDHSVSPLSGAQIVAEKGSSKVSVKISNTSSITDSVNQDVANFSAWSWIISAPLSKNSDDTEIANLDGLTNATSIELRYSNFRVPGKKNPMSSPITIAKTDAICARVRAAALKQTGTPSVPESGCDSNDVSKYGTQYDLNDFISAFWDIKDTKRWIWGASAKYGHQNFSFIDPVAVKNQKQDKYPWALGAFISYNPDSWQAIFTLSAQYQDSFKDATSGAICPVPGVPPAPINCLSGSIGKPQETKKKLLAIETRKNFGFAGMGLTVSRDLEGKVSSIELPISFIKDKDGNFIAGIKGGWVNDTKRGSNNTSVGIFVGTPFGLFK